MISKQFWLNFPLDPALQCETNFICFYVDMYLCLPTSSGWLEKNRGIDQAIKNKVIFAVLKLVVMWILSSINYELTFQKHQATVLLCSHINSQDTWTIWRHQTCSPPWPCPSLPFSMWQHSCFQKLSRKNTQMRGQKHRYCLSGQV